MPAEHEDNENEEKNWNDNNNEKTTDKPDDDEHDAQGEMLPEPDTTTSTRSVELAPRREAHRNTRECVCEETADDEVAKKTSHTCPTS